MPVRRGVGKCRFAMARSLHAMARRPHPEIRSGRQPENAPKTLAPAADIG
jgi:hypothetical protein